jgi:hypothetical protein
MGRNKGVDWGLELGLARKVSALLGEDGKVITVDVPGAGDVNNSQEAIDFCVSGRGDVIVRKKGGEEVTATVDFDKSDISYIAEGGGVNPFARGELFSIYAAAALVDLPVAIITERCYIEGIGFVGRDSRTDYYNGAALLIGGLATALPFGVYLYECRFPKWGLDNSLGVALEGGTDCRIERCSFEGVTQDFSAGIYAQGACENLDIIKNIFRDCTYGIEFGSFAGGGPDALILSNHFIGSKALNIPSAAPALFADNWLMTATDSASYSDTVDNLNALGVQFADNHYPE